MCILKRFKLAGYVDTIWCFLCLLDWFRIFSRRGLVLHMDADGVYFLFEFFKLLIGQTPLPPCLGI